MNTITHIASKLTYLHDEIDGCYKELFPLFRIRPHGFYLFGAYISGRTYQNAKIKYGLK